MYVYIYIYTSYILYSGYVEPPFEGPCLPFVSSCFLPLLSQVPVCATNSTRSAARQGQRGQARHVAAELLVPERSREYENKRLKMKLLRTGRMGWGGIWFAGKKTSCHPPTPKPQRSTHMLIMRASQTSYIGLRMIKVLVWQIQILCKYQEN